MYNAVFAWQNPRKTRGYLKAILPHTSPSPRAQNNDYRPPRYNCAGFSQGLSGPFCSLLLGDLGARVLKVEPLAGDWARHLEPRQGNHSAVFLALNRNKTSIALDYQSASGQEVVHQLARRADMVLYDAHPKHARTLGLDYATLAAQNPQLNRNLGATAEQVHSV